MVGSPRRAGRHRSNTRKTYGERWARHMLRTAYPEVYLRDRRYVDPVCRRSPAPGAPPPPRTVRLPPCRRPFDSLSVLFRSLSRRTRTASTYSEHIRRTRTAGTRTAGTHGAVRGRRMRGTVRGRRMRGADGRDVSGAVLLDDPGGDLGAEEKPSLARMLATCRAAVAGLITRSSAMALLLMPLAISSAISHSRQVSVVSGATTGFLPSSRGVSDWLVATAARNGPPAPGTSPGRAPTAGRPAPRRAVRGRAGAAPPSARRTRAAARRRSSRS